MKWTLIIPVHNEALVISQTLEVLVRAFEKTCEGSGEWCIIVVDNASSDGTGERVRRFAHSHVELIELPEKGKGRAVRAGISAASSGVVGYTDVDLAVSPDDIISAFQHVASESSDVVIGSRFHAESVMMDREWWRTWSSRVFNAAARFIVGVHTRDTQCPLKVMRTSVAPLLLSTSDPTWFFDLEFLALLEQSSFRVEEFSVQWNEHTYPERRSKLSMTKDGIRALGAMWKIRRTLRKRVEISPKSIHDERDMKWTIVGLGNPGKEYETTRHNAGRMLVERISSENGFSGWEYSKVHSSFIGKGTISDHEVVFVLPETYMNASGESLVKLVKYPADAEHLIVVHDDIDLPIGSWKISFDRGSGGHNGLKSIMSVLKTNAFLRVRVGVASVDERGVGVKPKGDDAVSSFVLGKFTEDEKLALLRIFPDISSAIAELMMVGKEAAMNHWNTRQSTKKASS